MTARRAPALLFVLAAWACACAAADEGGFHLKWAASDAPRRVWAVYPHPSDPAVAWAATADGLVRTDDGGRTWRALPAAGRLGRITAFDGCPADDRRLVAGTDEKGLWLSTDGGGSWRQICPRATTPADARVEHVAFSPVDPSWRTVFASYGEAAAGILVTRDLGGSFEMLATDRYLGRFLFVGPTIVAAGAMLSTEGTSWGIHRSGWDGQRWQECNRDLRPGEAAATWLDPQRILFSTLDGRILRSDDDGRTWEAALREDGARWVSLLRTWGATDRAELLAAYDPHRRGVLLTGRDFLPYATEAANEGLFIGPFVKSGASCRAAADGLTWYAVINDVLWIGRRTPREAGPTILQTRCTPAVQWLDRAARAAGPMQFTITAQLHHPDGPPAVTRVQADLEVLTGLARRMQDLYDDGKHADGKAADGLWGAQVSIPAGTVVRLRANDPRLRLPGRIALNLAAADAKRLTDARVAVMAAYEKPEPVALWSPTSDRGRTAGVEGPVSIAEFLPPASAHDVAALVVDATGPGPWRAGWVVRGGAEVNLAGCDTLSLRIKGTVSQEIYVHVLDHYNDVDVPHFSRGVPLIAGGFLKQITAEYQAVRVPMSQLLPAGTLFLRRLGAGVGLSTDAAGKAGRYSITDVQAVP